MKSGLLVDYDNIASAVGGGQFHDNIDKWLLWLEDGALSPRNRRRKFVVKRVYWNAQYDVHRDAFESRGFQAFTCTAFAKNKVDSGKSSADTFITMDAVDLSRNLNMLDELIILTTDSDFVPVVNRLQDRGLRMVTAGKETDPTYGLYSKHADAVLHVSALKAACQYERAPRKWYRLKSPPPEIAPLTQAAERASPLLARMRRSLAEEADNAPPAGNPEIAQAAKLIAALGERTPDQSISRTKILKALGQLEGFSSKPKGRQPAWFGYKSYHRLMNRIAKDVPAIQVKTSTGNGVQVIYRNPARAKAKARPDEDASATA